MPNFMPESPKMTNCSNFPFNPKNHILELCEKLEQMVVFVFFTFLHKIQNKIDALMSVSFP